MAARAAELGLAPPADLAARLLPPSPTLTLTQTLTLPLTPTLALPQTLNPTPTSKLTLALTLTRRACCPW